MANKDLAFRGLNDLAARESKLDLKVYSFIKEQFQRQRLFWTFNHPSQVEIMDLAVQILNALGLEDDLSNYSSEEILNNTVYPIMPSVSESLNLKFDVDPSFRIRGRYFSIEEIIEAYCSFYSSNPDLVDLNRSALIN